MNDIIEALAKYAHNAWAGWMKYMFAKGTLNDNGEMVLPKWAVERWTRQMNTAYADLPDEEKTSDRDEAKQILTIINNAIQNTLAIELNKLASKLKELIELT